MTFSEIVKKKRWELGLTYVQFSRFLDRNWVTIWRWEKGLSVPKDEKRISKFIEGMK